MAIYNRRLWEKELGVSALDKQRTTDLHRFLDSIESMTYRVL